MSLSPWGLIFTLASDSLRVPKAKPSEKGEGHTLGEGIGTEEYCWCEN